MGIRRWRGTLAFARRLKGRPPLVVSREQAIALAVAAWEEGPGTEFPANDPYAVETPTGWTVSMRSRCVPQFRVQVDGWTGETEGAERPIPVPFFGDDRRRGRRLAFARRLLRLPPLRVSREGAIEAALAACRREVPGFHHLLSAGPHAVEGLRDWTVWVRPEYKGAPWVRIDGQTGAADRVRPYRPPRED